MTYIDILKLGVTFFSGGLAGAVFTFMVNNYRNRIQKMLFAYMEDDVQSKVPAPVDEVMYTNLHMKKFQIKNTTNRDIEKFSVRFVFDLQAVIIDYVSHTKAGDSKTNITLTEGKKNECVLKVASFNRGDKVDLNLRVGNITNNDYYATEMDCIGFRLNRKDKRKKQGITTSLFSEALR